MTAPVNPPLSWQAVEFVAALLSAISVDNGNYSDLGETVKVEPDQEKAPTAPLIAVMALSLDAIEEKSGRNLRTETMPVQCDAYIPLDLANAQQRAHEAMHDMRWALQRQVAVRPPGITGIDLESAEFVRRPEGAALIQVQVIARVRLADRQLPA